MMLIWQRSHTVRIAILAGLLLLTPSAMAEFDLVRVDFDRDIRPIISENCVFCHGPDAAERQAGLRLDTEDDALAVIQPGDHQASELFDRLISDDKDTLMPPPESNRKLTKQQIELIGRWIDEGAAWEKHWSFKPIKKPPVPKVKSVTPIRNPIDAFVQHALLSHPLEPSPAADRATLIRRLSLDLTGLPPKPADVDAFVNNDHPKAYDHLVQRLLDSPAYGQRMAWDWLDAARYADTNGYQGDRERTMWPWRDWVIDAFNENLPYDEFTLWQLAGDQLPAATEKQKLATAFCRNYMINGEGGRIAEENRVEYVMDMSETMGTVWLGLTLNCCRCHDHKYDPITNKEYYQFFAFFNQTEVKGSGGDPQTAPNMPIMDEIQRQRIDDLQNLIAKLDQQQSARVVAIAAKQPTWEQQRRDELSTATVWEKIKPHQTFSQRQRMRVLPDRSILTSGKNPKNDTYTILSNTNLTSVTGVRIETLLHPTMTQGGSARSNSGNFVLTSFEVALVDKEDPSKRIPLTITSGDATFEQSGFKITNVFDDNLQSGWAVHEGRPVDREHTAVLRFKQPVQVPASMAVEFVMRHDSAHEYHNLGCFRLSLTDAPAPELEQEQDALIVALIESPKQRSDEQRQSIARAFRESDAQYAKVMKKRNALVKSKTKLQKDLPKVMVMQDMATPRKSFVLERGLYNKPTGEVTRDFPNFLPKPDAGQANLPTPNRLSLARWLVADDNPLTARVTVNRFWQQVFGIGLVKTTEDFGRQGEIPIHRELLDWLAADFRDGGWNVKDLMRTIVTSHTYRQTSKVNSAKPSAYMIDPHNRFLARGARYRMPSWMLRDQALAVSGLLSDVVSGPAVNTYQPPGIWEEASFGKKTYKQDEGEKLYRRSLFTFWRRIIAPTMFFDNASRQTCTVKPGRTNTPLHALQTLNNIAFVESARMLAEYTLQHNAADDDVETADKNDAERIDIVFKRVLSRMASDSERKVLLGGLQRTREQFAADSEAAQNLLNVGESARDQSIDAVEHASWTALCLAVLNLDETLNRE